MDASATPACPRCDVAGQQGNFCTSCGYDLRPPGPVVVTPRHRQPPLPVPQVVDCPVCGARNAKSRRVCARCRAPLDGTATAETFVAGEAEAPVRVEAAPRPADGFGPALRVQPPPPRSPRLLLAVVGVAGLVFVGVTVSLLVARGVGPFPEPEPDSTAPAPLAVSRVRASSAQPAEPPQRLVDGDAETSWAAPGPGVGQWVEVSLERRAMVTRVTLWNGDQRGARFLNRNRVRELRIDIGEERFTAELLDTQGPQAVDLPRPVRAQRLRLTILSVFGAAPDADAALSELEVYGAPER